MSMTDITTFRIPVLGGGSTFVRNWQTGATATRGVVIIAHGVSEHSDRYDRVARVLAAHGLATYAADHRGHGHTANGALGVAGPDGWEGIIDDTRAVLERAVAAHPGVPAFLLGHSMGSMVAQRFVALYGERLAGVILSGTVVKLDDPSLITMARAAAEKEPSQPATLFLSMFANFNTPFEAVTGFEWLSRDAAEVRKYVDDPMSGNPLTNATLADFLPGWALASSDDTRARVPKALPVLLISGDRDPAGANGAAPTELAETYRKNGSTDVTVRLYPEARHELFNETNRDDVVRELVEWIDAHLGVPK